MKIKESSEKVYALYKGDEFIMIGTQKELADYLGVKENTIYFYSTPTYMRRTDGRGLVTVKIDD